MRPPRLRGNLNADIGPWPIGEIPDEVIIQLGANIVHCIAIGGRDITGDGFGDMFASSVSGYHRSNPLGIIDVVRGNCGWSVKTVKDKFPHESKKVRLISGRNSPDYSLGISDPRKNISNTGRAVLSVWNQRVRESSKEVNDLRLVTLVRNIETKKFLLFEEEISRFSDGNYTWKENKRNNFEGFDKATNLHCFTWQPHGSQFTIIRIIPGSAKRFSINKDIEKIDQNAVLNAIQYDSSWISIDC